MDGQPAPDISGAVKAFFLWAGRVVGGAFVLALLIAILGRIYRRLGAVFAAGDHRRVYLAALDALSAVGIRRAYGESREAFARRVAEDLPSFIELTRGHVGARFGSRGAPGGDPSALFRALRRELSKAVPTWRRALGILSPWTWLLSR